MTMLARAVVLLLLCMNLGVAAWWLGQPSPVTPPLPASDANIPTLKLLSEVERRPVSESAESSQAPQLLSDSAVCLSLGPFATPADLRSAMDALLPEVERIQFREVPAVALRGYRVFLPPAASRAEALQTARALAARGITDYYVVTAGAQRDTISLGIFGDLANATERRNTVAALGYAPFVEPRTESIAQWWIDLAVEPGFDWRRLLPDPALAAQSSPCNAVAASAR